MSNTKRGMVPVEIDGEQYLFRVTMKAIRQIEEHFDRPFLEVFRDDAIKKFSSVDYLSIIWAALDHKGNEKVPTVEDLEESIDLGDLMGLFNTLLETINASSTGKLTKAMRKAKVAKKGNPPKG